MSSTDFTPGSLLWVKLEGYPWWPCQTVDPEQVALEAPEGLENPLAVIYLGSNDVGYINGGDLSAIEPFDANDTEKCEACASDPTLSAALQAANELLAGATFEENEAGAAASSDDDDELLHQAEGGGEAAADGETEDERRIRRKKEKKEKKSKKDKKDKNKDKKEKKHRRDEDDDVETARPKRSSGAASSGRRGGEKRHRPEQQRSRREEATSHYDVEEEEVAPIKFEKIDVTDDILLQLKDNLEKAVEEGDYTRIRDSLSDLSRINVTFEQLLSTGIGQAVGLVCDTAPSSWDQSFAPLQQWAGTIIRYWFSQIPDQHKSQLVVAEEVDRASVASQDDIGSQTGDTVAKLDKLGLEIEKAFSEEELVLASTTSAADLALAVQLAIESLDENHKTQRGVEVITTLSRADHGELRLKLLRGDITPAAFVADPIRYGLSEQDKKRIEEAEAAAGKAMDITGEKERIVHAIAVAEVVEK